MGVIELGRKIVQAEEVIDKATSALGWATDIEAAAAKLRQANGVDVQAMLRRYHRMPGQAVSLAVVRDQIANFATSGLEQMGHVKDAGVNGGATLAFGKSVETTVAHAWQPTFQAIPHLGTKVGTLAGEVGVAIGKFGFLRAMVPVVAEAYLGLQAADAFVGTGMPFVEMRLTHAKRVARGAAIEQVLEENRRERVDGFFDNVTRQVQSMNPEAGQLLARTWNETSLNLTHEKHAVLGVEKALGKLAENAEGTSFKRTSAARNAARYIEAFFTDVTADKDIDPQVVAKMLLDTNAIQARSVWSWPARATTFNVLGVMAIDNIDEMLKSNKSTLTGEDLSDADRASLKSAREKINNKGLELNKGIAGLPFVGLHKKKGFPWVGVGRVRLLKDNMLSRPVIRFNKVKPAAEMVQKEIVGLVGLLAPDQIELLTQLSQNLQVGFVEELPIIGHKRNERLRRDALGLMNRFGDEILTPLHVTDREQKARIKTIENLEARLVDYAAPQTNGDGEYDFTEIGDNRFTRGWLGLQMVSQINEIIKAEFAGHEKGVDTRKAPTLGVRESFNLVRFIMSKGQKIQDASQERQLLEAVGVIVVGSTIGVWQWLRGSVQSIPANLAQKAKDLAIAVLPFDRSIKWLLNKNIPFIEGA